MARKKKKNQKLAQEKKQPERVESFKETVLANGAPALESASMTDAAAPVEATRGLVEMAEALEAELNSAGVVEGRMLTRLLNASELVGSLCLPLIERLQTKWVVSGALGSALLYTGGDPSVALLVLGGLVNGILGKLAKAILAQPRPNGAPKTDNGMPSSHALLLFFFGSYCAVFCMKMAYAVITMPKPSGITTAAEQHDAALSVALRAVQWIVGAALSIIFPAVLSWSRVNSGLHTTAQVVVGALIGGVNGAAWAKFESSMLLLVVEMLPDGKVGYSGTCILICAGALVVGWSDLRQRTPAEPRHNRTASDSSRAKSKKD